MRIPSIFDGLLLLLLLVVVLLLLLQQHADAFTMPNNSRRTSTHVLLRMSDSGSIMERLSNRFGSDEKTSNNSSKSTAALRSFVLPDSFDVDDFDGSPEELITRAKVIVSTNLGIENENLLDDNFLWIGPLLDTPLSKKEYLAAGRFFDLRSTFPDLDFRAHDYRIDEVDPFTVRLTARTVGTMRGELRLRDKTLPPNGQLLRCPPEAISITFDANSGKVAKLCTGFTMDRLVGNTNGLCGVLAAATIAGEPPSEWEVYPPLTVIQRFLGRPVKPIGESTSFLAPFPETVMVQLAKGVLSSNVAADDPSLLGPNFTFMTPNKGPIGKKRFLEEFASREFDGVEPELSHFRVDPYDPNRVWVDVRPVAPGYEGPPQAMSFAFDDDGFCTRITSSAVMDPSLGKLFCCDVASIVCKYKNECLTKTYTIGTRYAGNAGGLGGPEGFKYARGEASPGIVTRPFPRVISRLQKRAISPITKIGVDDYFLPDMISNAVPKRVQKSVEKLSSLKANRVVEQISQSSPSPSSTLKQSPPSMAPSVVPKAETPKKDEPKLEAPTFDVPAFNIPQLGETRPKVAKTAAKPIPSTKKPATKYAVASKPKQERNQSQKRLSFNLPSFAAQTGTRPKVPARKPVPRKFTPKKPSPVTKKPAVKDDAPRPSFSLFPVAVPDASTKESTPKTVAKKPAAKISTPRPSFSLFPVTAPKPAPTKAPKTDPKVPVPRPSFSLFPRSAQKTASEKSPPATKSIAKSMAAKKEADRKRREAAANKAFELEQAKLRREALLKEEAEKRRRAEEEKKRLEEFQKQAVADAARQRQQLLKAEQERRQAEQQDLKRIQEIAKQVADETAKEQAEMQRNIQKKKLAAQAEARRQAEEANRQLQEKQNADAEQRKRELEERRAAVVEERRQAEEAKRQMAEQRKQEAEAKRVAQAEARKQQKEAAKAEEERKRQEFLAKREAAKREASRKSAEEQKRMAAKATSTAAKAKPSASINLFGLGGEPAAKPSKPNNRKVKDVKTRPTINLFGGGQPATSKPAATKAGAATPRPTINLFGGASEKPKPAAKKPEVSKLRPTINLFSGEAITEAPSKPAAKQVEISTPRPTFNIFGGAEPASKTASQPSASAIKAAEKARPGASISLFGLGGAPSKTKSTAPKSTAAKPSRKPASKSVPRPTAPRGVPSLTGWKQNGDRTISGNISGSPNFRNGERITTSPIAQGEVTSGKIVKTASGSRYFLN